SYNAGDFLICHNQSSMFIYHIRSIVLSEMDETIKLKVDQILTHQKLPNHHSSNSQCICKNEKELWLVKGEMNLINLENIDQYIIIWLCDQLEPVEYEFYIQEILNVHFHHDTEEQFLEINKSFDLLKWDRYIQTLQDAYNSIAGKACTLLEATFSILNVIGEKAFIEYWRNIKKLFYWSRMLNPLRHRQTEVLNKWHTKHGIIQTTAISQLCIVWSVEVKVLKIAFSVTMTKRTYHKLQESLMKECEMLILNFKNLSNLHVNVHFPQHARNFRILVNMIVSVKEMALRHIINSLTDSHFDTNTNTFSNLIMYLNLYPILSD
ncbi:72_t:CDS:2, partial [Funneliformis geosporum]